MNAKMLIVSIGVFLFLLFTGLYFVYDSLSNEEVLEKNETESQESVKNQKKVFPEISNTDTSSTSPSIPTSEAEEPEVKNSKKPIVAKSTTPSQVSKPIPKTKSNEVVVDQVIHSTTKNIIETKPLPQNVVGLEKEKIEVEITLYDGVENKLLTNYSVEISYEHRNESEKLEKYTTGKDGKFIFTTTQTGLLRLLIITKDFSAHARVMRLLNGRNVYTAKLYKGGVLEVRATNQEGKAVLGLSATLSNGFRATSAKDAVTLEYDQAKNIYFMTNVPIGSQDIFFKANGYKETDTYKVKVESKSTATLEVRFQAARLLTFELDIKKKPDLIYVSNIKTTAIKNPDTVASSRLPNRNPIVPVNSGSRPVAEEKAEVFKNQNNHYDYELTIKNATCLTVEVDGFVPKEIWLSPDKDTYKITLIEGFVGTLQINNEKGLPVSGAGVNYSSGAFNQNAFSDEKGIVLLSGMTEHLELRLNVTHNNYATFSEKWTFDADENNAKTIVLKEGKGISGRVSFEGKSVAGAKVMLYQSGKATIAATMDTASDGSFSFNKLDGKADVGYLVSAFHHEFGVATSSEIKFDGKNPVVELILIKQKSLTVKLVDSKGVALPNKNITVINDADSQYSFSVMTNEKGEYEFFNLFPGLYTVNLQESKFKSKEVKTTIPAGVITLTARSRDLKKVNIKVAGGKPFTADLRVTLERNDWPIVVVVDEDGYFVEFQEGDPIVFVVVVFHAQGYGDVRVGPFDKKENLPDDFNIEFRVGENFKVKVIDDEDNKPIPFVTVDIFSGSTKIEALPTNEQGELRFSYLSGKFVVNVKEDGYAAYSNEFDSSQSHELLIRLFKGGGIKGHLTLKKEVAKTFVLMQPGDINQQLDALGNFEILNLVPGEYEISVSRYFKDGKNQIEKIPTRIFIEREKTFEINLDDFQKNQTTLEVTVFKDGDLSIERGYLNITDRRGKSVVATTIDNGKFTVERIVPGEFLLSYTFQGRTLQKAVAILPKQTNVAEIYLPGSSVTFSIKNLEGAPISKVMVTLYCGEKYRQEDTYIGNQMITDPRGMGTFFLMPKTPYYFLIEEDFRFNYQINMIGPIILEAGQAQRIDYILPYARKLPKIQVTDMAGKPLSDVGFLFNDENGNFFQRSLLKEWDFFPYSNVEGYLPENSWPKGNFTLVVGKEGYEYKELAITEDFDATQLTQIKLNKGCTVTCNFPQALPFPVSVGILNKDGVLLQKPIPYPSRKKHELTVYFENISSGSVKFTDLAAGEYFIGYFWNGSNRLISKQPTNKLGVGANAFITSDLKLSEE